MNEVGIIASINSLDFFSKRIYISFHFFEIRGILFLHAPLEFPSDNTAFEKWPKKSGFVHVQWAKYFFIRGYVLT